MIPSEVSDEDMEGAIANIARTADGQLLYCWLQKERMTVLLTADPGALHHHNGHRSLCAKLMALMGPAIAESAGAPGRESASRPVVFAGRKPASVGSNARGTRRRVTDDTIVPGYDTE